MKGGERIGVGDAAGGFLRMQNPRDAKGEPERCVGEAGFAMRGGGGDCVFVYANKYVDQYRLTEKFRNPRNTKKKYLETSKYKPHQWASAVRNRI